LDVYLFYILQLLSFSVAKNNKKAANIMLFFRFCIKHKNYLTIERQATNLQPHPRAVQGGSPLTVLLWQATKGRAEEGSD